MIPRHHSLHARYARRGSVYLVILGLSVLVAVIGLGGVLLSRTQSRVADLQSDIAEARSYAFSAIEIGRTIIAHDASWRSTHSNGAWISNQAFGNGQITLTVVNPRGALNRAFTDPVVLTATGTTGNAVQTVQVTLNPAITPCTSLNTALTANSITIGGGNINGNSMTLAALTTIAGGSGKVYPDAEAPGTIIGNNYQGQVTPNAAARTVPDSSVFDYYIANGTAISTSSLPLAGGNFQLNQVLLSPTYNPFGPANAQGIYVIDCAGGNIQIQDCRVVGTLVLLNTGAASVITGGINLAPAVANFPALLVKGSFNINPGSTLSESTTVNFNPVGTPYPYPGGATNATNTDSYPSIISGLTYISGDVNLPGGAASLTNLITGGAFTNNGAQVTLYFANTWAANPPPGFFSCPMTPATASWKRVVN